MDNAATARAPLFELGQYLGERLEGGEPAGGISLGGERPNMPPWWASPVTEAPSWAFPDPGLGATKPALLGSPAKVCQALVQLRRGCRQLSTWGAAPRDGATAWW